MEERREERGAGLQRSQEELDARAAALQALEASSVPCLVAGAYAFFEYTGLFRDTKDLDLMLRERDLPAAFRSLEGAGFRAEIVDPVWLGKAFRGPWLVDLIFSSANGVAGVDDDFFEHARTGRVMGRPALLAPPEEIIWSKAFVLERERYDGADLNHLFHACGAGLDWRRLWRRMERHWEVLLSHLLLFRFAYPGSAGVVPAWLVRELARRTRAMRSAGAVPPGLCRGNLLSRELYQPDLDRGMGDGRRWDEADRAGPGQAGGDGGDDLQAGGGR
jgi:hypothetical protein